MRRALVLLLVAALLEPLLGQPLPGRDLCELLLKIPSL
jgi:hypothetical protein